MNPYTPRPFPQAAPTTPPASGLAITSLVLGILSLVACLGIFAGIPAIVCGHLARGRAKRQPEAYTGAGMALAGLILGYLSIVLTALVVTGLIIYVSTLARAAAIGGGNFGQPPSRNPLSIVTDAKNDSEAIVCANNLKQIGLAFRLWSTDNDDRYPFNVSTNHGGSMELCSRKPTGFEANPVPHFQTVANELFYPAILHCPGDKNTQPAGSFAALTLANVTYLLRTGSEVNDTNPQEVLCRCPVHDLVLLADGSVVTAP